jgi:hypothetical protein
MAHTFTHAERRRGGRNATKLLSAEQRVERARDAAKKRWSNFYKKTRQQAA